LFQTLSNSGSPLASSPSILSALQKAPASDIVQLSSDATQLESVDAILGISNGSNGSYVGFNGLNTTTTSPLTNLETLLSGSGATSNLSQADQLATYQSALQAQDTQSLFGSPTTGNLNNSLLNVVG
jgi:hypothetical protein